MPDHDENTGNINMPDHDENTGDLNTALQDGEVNIRPARWSFAREFGVDKIKYKGKEYVLNESTCKWHRDFIAVHEDLAKTINGIAEKKILEQDPDFEDFWEFGFIFRQMEDYNRSIKFFEWAMACDPERMEIRWILPCLSSNYRKVNLHNKAIELPERFPRQSYRNAALFTSIAGAYLDIGDCKNAKQMADRAYAIYRSDNKPIPQELHAVYGRLRSLCGMY